MEEDDSTEEDDFFQEDDSNQAHLPEELIYEEDHLVDEEVVLNGLIYKI